MGAWTTAGASGTMALAVPAHVVSRLLGRSGDRPLLGIEAHEVALPETLAARLPERPADADDDLPPALLVARVEPQSAAERAGLLLGDLLFAVDGAPVEGSAGLLNALDGHAGGPLRLGILRAGLPRDVVVAWS